jgi:hypothetical protein
MDTCIGKIVKSNSHIDYVCQVYGPAERTQVPAPCDCSFGRFVRIAGDGSAGGVDLVGIIYNTILMNPDFGTLGPRLSSRSELEIFSPDYLNEQITLVGILVLGSLPTDGRWPAVQGIPPLAARPDAFVTTLDDDELRRFHSAGDGPQLAYLPHLLSQNSPLIPHLTLAVLDQVSHLFPDQAQELAVLRDNLAWRTQVEQAR